MTNLDIPRELRTVASGFTYKVVSVGLLTSHMGVEICTNSPVLTLTVFFLTSTTFFWLSVVMLLVWSTRVLQTATSTRFSILLNVCRQRRTNHVYCSLLPSWYMV